VAVGDFNGDGKPDLAVATGGSDGDDGVWVLLGNGNGTFAAVGNYSAELSPWSVAVGDFNGDGKADLAVATYASNTVSVLLGTGTGCLPLTILKQQAMLNFAEPNADSFSLTASLDPGAGFSPSNQVVHLNMGGADIELPLDAKGGGRTVNLAIPAGSVKLALNKKTGNWTLTAKFKSGSWSTAWQAHGLYKFFDLSKTDGWTVTLPVTVTIGNKTFGGQRRLAYTAKAGISGSAK
jgi:hypothetical protein